MFGGIIESTTTITSVAQTALEDGRTIHVRRPEGWSDCVVGQSVAVNGICLTIRALQPSAPDSTDLVFDLAPETLKISAAGHWRSGTRVHVERSLALGDRLHGHWVLGHVDAVGRCVTMRPSGQDDGWILELSIPTRLRCFVVHKGGITVDGVALTVASVRDDGYDLLVTVAVVPHTWRHTIMSQYRSDDLVNVEIDALARYANSDRSSQGEPLFNPSREWRSSRPVSLATVPELITQIAAGRPVVIVDDEQRENEGDLVVAAAHATSLVIAFMIRYGRGLVCLSLVPDRAQTLGLELQPRRNIDTLCTAFTVSIDARLGISTGISASDRAQTVAAAVAANAGKDDLVTPGHVFPLIAHPRGVLGRQGHTEASVDLARLAGLTPAGVICEILREDGEPARLPELQQFCAEHRLLLGSVADLTTYRKATGAAMETGS